MNKELFIQKLTEQLEKDLAQAKEIAAEMRDEVINEESKPENEYDTRALEASYLAGAQSKRIVQIQEVLNIFKTTKAHDFKPNDPISITALIEVLVDDKKLFLFMMPKGGGLQLHVDGHSVQIVTPSSPLGEALLGLKSGDFASYEVGTTEHEYEIISVK